ncbi:MAG: aminotransferase class I/II-fold pyridoxal phosphate-dependent enzyme [Eubacteriales bacterium]|nr:aminotransferase class I/II-fold pyridoxal phosphate-dependent enzyme [Eubacteriales bacterium]
MRIEIAEKMKGFEAGIFQILNEKKIEMQEKGKKVYNFSIGTPDFEPFPHIIETVSKACMIPENYKYSVKDMDELVEAVVSRYQKRYGVELEKNEVMSVYGSQEGMAHIFQPLINPNDIVLLPNPGYPIFSMGAFIAQANQWFYPLYEDSNYLPDFKAIPDNIKKAAKVMVVSYPANPICVTAPDSFYEELIAFAKENEIMIIHDNAYSDIVYDGRPGKSFLSFPGAKEVGVEFYSLSKTFNYTGARMSFVVGNAEMIQAFQTFRSQIDYGIFYPIQMGAIDALTGDYEEEIHKQCLEYQKRRDALCEGLTEIGWKVPKSEGTMFAWGRIPEGYDSSEAFVMDLLEKTGVICTPGSSFGSLGEGYVRFALVLPPETIKEAVEAIRLSGIFEK